MAFTAAVEWDVRVPGDDTNGGGFAVGSGGIDFSQQNAAQVTYTDLVIDGTTNTNCTSAAFPFTSISVGNIINITGGTGFTVQRVQIISVAGGVATCDKSLGTLSSTGGQGKLGGSLASPGQGSALMVAGNTLHIKAGTYTITSASTNVAGGCLLIPSGSITAFTRAIGYQNTHRDGGLRPLLQASGISTFTLCNGASSTGVMFENITVDGASLTSSKGFGAVARALRCKAMNCTNNGFSAPATYCEATGCSTGVAFTGAFFYGCVAYNNSSTGIVASSVAVNCLSVNNSGSFGFSIAGGAYAFNCTAYGNGSSGFNAVGGATLSTWTNCVSTGNAGYQFGGSGAGNNVILINCAAKADGSGTIDTANITAPTVGQITLTADPFTNAAGGDFSLNSLSGGGAACKAAGLLGVFPGVPTVNTTGFQDIGAVQHQGMQYLGSFQASGPTPYV